MKTLISRAILILIEILVPAAFAQPDEVPCVRFRSFPLEFAQDLGTQLSSPLHLNGRGWALTGAAALTTAALFQIDESVAGRVRDIHKAHPWLERTAPYVSELGGTGGIVGVLGFGAVSWLLKRPREVETAYLMGQALLTSGLVCRLGKTVTGRSRPSAAWRGDEYQDKWNGPFSQFRENHGSITRYDAFPSGHTTSAVSIAAVAAEQYGNRHPWVPFAAYFLAGGVGAARMIEETHWVSDIFVGACLGYLSGRQVVRLHRQRAAEDCGAQTSSDCRFQVIPFSDGAELKVIRTF